MKLLMAHKYMCSQYDLSFLAPFFSCNSIQFMTKPHLAMILQIQNELLSFIEPKKISISHLFPRAMKIPSAYTLILIEKSRRKWDLFFCCYTQLPNCQRYVKLYEINSL